MSRDQINSQKVILQQELKAIEKEIEALEKLEAQQDNYIEDGFVEVRDTESKRKTFLDMLDEAKKIYTKITNAYNKYGTKSFFAKNLKPTQKTIEIIQELKENDYETIYELIGYANQLNHTYKESIKKALWSPANVNINSMYRAYYKMLVQYIDLSIKIQDQQKDCSLRLLYYTEKKINSFVEMEYNIWLYGNQKLRIVDCSPEHFGIMGEALEETYFPDLCYPCNIL